jgi:hypothetical protein
VYSCVLNVFMRAGVAITRTVAFHAARHRCNDDPWSFLDVLTRVWMFSAGDCIVSGVSSVFSAVHV